MNHANRSANTVRSPVIYLFIIFLMGAIYGCTTAKPSAPPPAKHFTGNRIAFLPVKNMARVYGVNKSVISPISGTYFMTGDVMKNAEGLLADGLVSRLKNRYDIALITSEQAKNALAAILTDGNTIFTEKKRLVAIGRELKADAVLAGYLYRCRQRVGNRYSVNSPASVAFEFYLLSVSDEAVIWSGSYNETQLSLSEDLFKIKSFIKRRRWITAGEMAADGLEEILKDFPAK